MNHATEVTDAAPAPGLAPTSEPASAPARGLPFTAYDSETCSIARTLALIGDRWTLLILRDVTNGVRRFDDLAAHLGVARNVLSKRLAALVEEGIVIRTGYRSEGARERYEYRLTEAGRDLLPILLAFMGWGDRHLAGVSGVPSLPTHADCGAPVQVSLVCAEGHELGPRPRLSVAPGPGARLKQRREPSTED